MQPMYEKQSKTKLVTTVITIIVIAGIVMFADHLKSTSTSTAASLPTTTSSQSAPAASTPPTSTPATSTPSATTAPSSGYKDGTYTASSSYYVPNGNENIKVTLAVSNGVVSSASVFNSEGDPTSAYFQQNFASSFKHYVVGQKIASLQLGVIAGASDTSQGFNNALSRIESQAKA